MTPNTALSVAETMSAQDLDQTYTALCNALASVGEAQAQSFLAMLSLSLIAHSPSTPQVLTLIAQAQEQCLLANS
ncbi:MAG: hypothetical protein RL535_846 [Pseudomonadota bacterium]